TRAPRVRTRRCVESVDCIAIEAAGGGAAAAEATVAAASSLGARVIVVDGYQFPAPFHRRLRDAGLKLAAIDDNGEIGACVGDLVVNPNRHAAPALYPQRAAHTDPL